VAEHTNRKGFILVNRWSVSGPLLPVVVFLTVFTPRWSDAQLLRDYGFTVGGVLAEQQWEYSPSALSEVGPTPGVPSSRLWGIDAGAFAEFFDMPYFSVLLELRYTQKGRVVTLTETVLANNAQGYIDLGPRDYAQRSHFLAFSVLPKLRFEFETLTPFVALGPSLEYLISTSSVHPQFRRYELAVSVVAGTEMLLGCAPKILAEVRYNPSLMKAYSTGLLTVKNSAIEFLVGLAF
jgi:hypothetical protein